MDAFLAKSDLKMTAFKLVLPEVVIVSFSLWNENWICNLKKESIQQKLHYNSHCHNNKPVRQLLFYFQSLLPVKMLDM